MVFTNDFFSEFLPGHSDTEYLYDVTSLKYLSNGLLASGSFETIKLWNFSTGFELKTLLGHKDWVYSLTEMSYELLASGSYDGEIKIWNISSGIVIRTLKDRIQIWDLVYLNNQFLVSGTSNSFQLWNAINGMLIKTFETDTILKFVIIPNGIVATASNNYVLNYSSIFLVDTTTLSLFKVLNEHTDFILGLELLRNGDLASASYDYTIIIWETLNYSVKKIINLEFYINQMALLSNGFLASIEDQFMSIWDTASGQKIYDDYFEEGFGMLIAPLPNNQLAITLANYSIVILRINFG
jgi:WD40 repeat protein